ncbi:MAG: Hsp20/alpha crystallin family protein [candidate division Zixibacteria bacterium]|nr:Hsp20/alpha crystallin family protein [candidate division Zixibacteria bacterium]
MTYLTVQPKRQWIGNEIDRMFEDMFHWPVARRERDEGFAPRVNIHESDDNLRLTFELPGMDKKDVKVTLVDGVLTVSGKREFVQKADGDHYHRHEISSGEFSRSFTLPDTVNNEKISADYKNGLLEVTLAKLEEVKPKEIEVQVS